MIYTSYFANHRKFPYELNKVAITRFPPKSWKDYLFQSLSPDKSLLLRYKAGKVTEAHYTKVYLHKLNTVVLDKYKSKEALAEILDESVLLCYCKDTFCHRHLFREWLQDGTNIKIKEL